MTAITGESNKDYFFLCGHVLFFEFVLGCFCSEKFLWVKILGHGRRYIRS